VREGGEVGRGEVVPEEMARPEKGKRATRKEKKKNEEWERGGPTGWIGRRRGDGPAACCRDWLKEKEINRRGEGGIWAEGEGKLIWVEKEKEKEIEDGFGTSNFLNLCFFKPHNNK
jgi:hypothetical protein